MQRVDNITTFFTHYFDQKVARVATLPLHRYTKKRFYAEFPPHRIVIAVFLLDERDYLFLISKSNC